ASRLRWAAIVAVMESAEDIVRINDDRFGGRRGPTEGQDLRMQHHRRAVGELGTVRRGATTTELIEAAYPAWATIAIASTRTDLAGRTEVDRAARIFLPPSRLSSGTMYRAATKRDDDGRYETA